MKTEEMPYDEAADHARREAEKEAQLELERLEIAERTLALERREAEVEQRLAETDRKAEEALREAEKILNETNNDRYYYGDFGYPRYYRGYYAHPYKNRYYYRNETSSIYFGKRPHIKHYKHRRYKDYRFIHKNAYRPNKYHGKKDGQQKKFATVNHFAAPFRSYSW